MWELTNNSLIFDHLSSGGKKGPRAYKLPDTIPAGEILTDLYKKQWKLGPPIGQGGFGMIYLGELNHQTGTYLVL